MKSEQDIERLLYSLYIYIFAELDRLENDTSIKSKPLVNHLKASSTDLYKYWLSEVRLETFKEFSGKITEILRYYDG